MLDVSLIFFTKDTLFDFCAQSIAPFDVDIIATYASDLCLHFTALSVLK
jgi:hypothetical protein